MENFIPVLDNAKLQEEVNNAAMKGALKAINDFYTSYNSPFVKMVTTELEKTEMGTSVNLPDVVALINEGLSKEIDAMANMAVAKTFIPKITRFLTRSDKYVNFSDILRKFIDVSDNENSYDFNVQIITEQYWKSVTIKDSVAKYEITLHHCHSEKGKYQLLSLPRRYDASDYSSHRKMSLKCDGVELQLPFTTSVLSDDFLGYLAGLVIGASIITLDCDDFEDEWFEKEE